MSRGGKWCLRTHSWRRRRSFSDFSRCAVVFVFFVFVSSVSRYFLLLPSLPHPLPPFYFYFHDKIFTSLITWLKVSNSGRCVAGAGAGASGGFGSCAHPLPDWLTGWLAKIVVFEFFLVFFLSTFNFHLSERDLCRFRFSFSSWPTWLASNISQCATVRTEMTTTSFEKKKRKAKNK